MKPVARAERERVGDDRPRDRHDAERGDAHHERVQRVLRAHEPGVEEPERRRHQQHERRRDEHPGGVAGVDRGRRSSEQAAHLSRPASPRPCPPRPSGCGRPARAASTKIFPSPTSPVRAPSQIALTVGSTKSSETRDLEAHLLGELHLHGRAAIGLDAVELAAVALDPAHREPAHLGAVERLEHVVRLVRPHDRDDELHGRYSIESADARPRVPLGVTGKPEEGLEPTTVRFTRSVLYQLSYSGADAHRRPRADALQRTWRSRWWFRILRLTRWSALSIVFVSQPSSTAICS